VDGWPIPLGDDVDGGQQMALRFQVEIGVEQGQPLVEDFVLRLPIKRAQADTVTANEIVRCKLLLVVHLDLDLEILEIDVGHLEPSECEVLDQLATRST
jgi:hypothetical protein